MIVEINKIEKYEDSIFGSCLIVESYPIIDSPFGFGGAVDLTRKFYFIYPDNKNFYDFIPRLDAGFMVTKHFQIAGPLFGIIRGIETAGTEKVSATRNCFRSSNSPLRLVIVQPMS